ncbi:MAG: AsmA family protein [Gammaproteobacteria bacterium]
MGKLLKILMTLAGILLLLIVLAVAAFSMLFDPNDYKTTLEQMVKEKTGQDLRIEGELTLSYFPWLGLSTGKIVLANVQGIPGDVSVEIGQSSAKVKLMPLLSKKIEIDKIALEGLSVQLLTDNKNIENWKGFKIGDKANPKADQGAKIEHEKKAEELPVWLTGMAVAGITLKDAAADWDDKKFGKQLAVKDLNIDVDNIAFDATMAIRLGFVLEQPQAKLIEEVKLTANVTVAETLDRFSLDNLEMLSTTDAEAIPGGALQTKITGSTVLNLDAQQVTIPDLKIRVGGLEIAAALSGTDIDRKPVFDGTVSIGPFNPSQLLYQRQISLPKMADANALSKLSADFNVRATKDSADLDALVVKLDDSTLRGYVKIADFANPAVKFDLAADTLDLDRYLAPPDNKATRSEPLAAPAEAVAAGAALLPVDTLKKLNLDGVLKVDTFKVKNLNMQGVNLKITAKEGRLAGEQSIKELYRGSYSGSVNIDVNGSEPVLTLNEKFNHIQIEPLYKDYKGKDAKITGKIDAATRLQGIGNNLDALKSTLNGQMSFLLADGVIKGINFQQIIDNVKSLIKNKPLATDHPTDQTVFSKIQGTAEITDGVLTNNDLIVDSSKLHMTGRGIADLSTEQLDYKLDIRRVKSKATDTEPERLGSTPLLIDVTGTFSEPVLMPDLVGILIEKNRGKIEKGLEKIEGEKAKLLEKLDRKLKKLF